MPAQPTTVMSGFTFCPATAALLGNRDWVIGPGEVAEFETRVPLWFGSLGQEPAEILSIFGRPGERMSIRVGPARE
jgi:hypothetical protein